MHGTVVTIFGKLEEELIEISFNIDALCDSSNYFIGLSEVGVDLIAAILAQDEADPILLFGALIMLGGSTKPAFQAPPPSSIG